MRKNNEIQESLMKLANDFLNQLDDLEQELSTDNDEKKSATIAILRDEIETRILRARAQLRN
jgi:hypothetical protein